MAIRPGRYDPQKPDVELLDYKSKKRYGLKLEGSGALQVGTVSQDDSVIIRNQGKRVGDFDEQQTWKGGRGIEKLSTNAEAYWDSKDMWTLSDNHMHQTLLWRFARGLRSSDFFMPDATHSLAWKQIFGTSAFTDIFFTATASYTAVHYRFWLRKIGSPGDLTLQLCADSGGVPGSVIQNASITEFDITDTISKLQSFTVTGNALTNGTVYHLLLSCDAGDNKNNHWEIGCYDGGANGIISSDGITYAQADYDPYYFVSDADTKRRWFSFFLDNAMYIVDRKDDGTTASKLYINGDRGKNTNVGNAATIQDTARSWTTNVWAGAWVRVIRGTGAGQSREIASNTATALTLTSSLDVALDTTSEYIIYATEWFTEVTSTGLGVVRSKPCVVNQIVYFPQGSATNIRVMVWSGTAHSFGDDSTNKASFLIMAVDPSNVRVWAALNGTGSGAASTLTYATASAWANLPTALSFAATKNIGDATYPITGIEEKDGNVYIFKEDGVWMSNYNAQLTRLNSGAEKTPSSSNGRATIAHQQFIYYSWMHSLVRIYGSSHDDIGQDWSGYGLPEGREGDFSSLDSYTSLLFAAVDAGDAGLSSVLGWDGIGWHEMVRAYDYGLRIRMVKIQPCPETRNRTWIDMGGDLVFQEMPFKKGTPRLDSGCRFMHEAVIESATIDMGTASGLPKFIKELVVSCDNLGNGNEIHVDYQVDDDVHTDRWIEATTLYESPESSAFLGLSNVRKFAYRLRVLSSDNTVPVDIRGVVPNGYARAPYKMIWTLRCRADNITARGRLVKPDILMRWLLDNARFPGRIQMKSQYQLAHDFYVIVHPPRMFPYKPAQNGQAEESIFTIVLEEA